MPNSGYRKRTKVCVHIPISSLFSVCLTRTPRVIAFGAELDGDKVLLKYALNKNGVVYSHDVAPTDDSALPKALRWMKFAAVLHAPLDAAEVDAAGMLLDTSNEPK